MTTKTKFLLEGTETLHEDLDNLLKNKHCIGFDDYEMKDGRRFRKYDYKNAWIISPYNFYSEDTIGWFQKNDVYRNDLSHPFWYYVRTAKAIYQESIKQDFLHHGWIDLQKMDVYQTRTSESTLRKKYVTYLDQIKKSELIKQIFKEENWIVPYYLYWRGHGDEKRFMQAVLELGESDGITVVVPEELAEKINAIIPKDEYKKDVLVIDMHK